MSSSRSHEQILNKHNEFSSNSLEKVTLAKIRNKIYYSDNFWGYIFELNIIILKINNVNLATNTILNSHTTEYY